MIKKRIVYRTTYLSKKKKNLMLFEGIYNCNLWKHILISKGRSKTNSLKVIEQNCYICSLRLKVINKGTSLWW